MARREREGTEFLCARVFVSVLFEGGGGGRVRSLLNKRSYFLGRAVVLILVTGVVMMC